MPVGDDDDWRFRKAQQLGLIDTRPVTLLPARPSVARAAPMPPTSPERGNRPAASTVVKTVPGGMSRTLLVCAALALTLFAAAIGWLLRGSNTPPLPMPLPMPASTSTVPPAAVSAPDVQQPDAQPLDVLLSIEPPRDAPSPVVPSPEPQPAAAQAVAVVAPPAIKLKPSPPATVTAPLQPPQVEPRIDQAQSDEGDARMLPRPSFSCRGVQTRVNQMICNSVELAAADVQMAQAFRAAAGRSDGIGEQRLDRDQSKFLNARAACNTASCIASTTRRRIAALTR